MLPQFLVTQLSIVFNTMHRIGVLGTQKKLSLGLTSKELADWE